MAQCGSLAAASSKPRLAWVYWKECMRATERSKDFWTSGEQETGKMTVPRVSDSVALEPAESWLCSASWAVSLSAVARKAAMAAMAMEAPRKRRREWLG